MTIRPKTTRAGRTAKISVSLDRADLATLRTLARRRHADNLSAALAEGVRLLREEEGRDALVNWLGEEATASPDERDAIRAAWRGVSSGRRRRRVA